MISAFAENPTPYNEWDFDISCLQVSQNPHNLEEFNRIIDEWNKLKSK